jgi:hypothetical protein
LVKKRKLVCRILSKKYFSRNSFPGGEGRGRAWKDNLKRIPPEFNNFTNGFDFLTSKKVKFRARELKSNEE